MGEGKGIKSNVNILRMPSGGIEYEGYEIACFSAGPSVHVPAMNRVKQYITEANLTSKAFPISKAYAAWETDEVISEELYR